MKEVIAKKIKFAAIILITSGIVLGITSIICFTVSAMDGFDLYLFIYLAQGFTAVTLIIWGVSNSALPKDLIVANEIGFEIVKTGELISYDFVVSVSSRHSERRLTIVATDGQAYHIDYVAKQKEVKTLIAQKVKEKTGHDIIIA